MFLSRFCIAVLMLGLASGCVTKYHLLAQPEWAPAPAVFEHWWEDRSYYALLEIAEACLHGKPTTATKRDIRRMMGRGIDNPRAYPHAGERMWVYVTTRHTPHSSYLLVYFDENDKVMDVVWVSE